MNTEQQPTEDPFTRSMELRATREESREVDFVCSTETQDTYGTILRQNWDLSRFDRNPVVLWAHQSRELPIGSATKTRVENGELVATIKIATAEANPKAENVWQSIRQKTLRGISVGFYPRQVREEKIDDKWVVILDDIELLELSITPLPSNPDALAKKARARAANQKTSPEKPAQTPADKRGEEDRMSLEAENAALKNTVAQRDGQIVTLEKQIADERTARKALEKEFEAATTERDTAKKRVAELENATVERDVSALVGVKIESSEKDEMVELAKSNRSLFDKLMAKRTPKATESKGSVLGETKAEARDIGGASDASDVADEFERDFGKANGFSTYRG